MFGSVFKLNPLAQFRGSHLQRQQVMKSEQPSPKIWHSRLFSVMPFAVGQFAFVATSAPKPGGTACAQVIGPHEELDEEELDELEDEELDELEEDELDEDVDSDEDDEELDFFLQAQHLKVDPSPLKALPPRMALLPSSIMEIMARVPTMVPLPALTYFTGLSATYAMVVFGLSEE